MQSRREKCGTLHESQVTKLKVFIFLLSHVFCELPFTRCYGKAIYISYISFIILTPISFLFQPLKEMGVRSVLVHSFHCRFFRTMKECSLLDAIQLQKWVIVDVTFPPWKKSRKRQRFAYVVVVPRPLRKPFENF